MEWLTRDGREFTDDTQPVWFCVTHLPRGTVVSVMVRGDDGTSVPVASKTLPPGSDGKQWFVGCDRLLREASDGLESLLYGAGLQGAQDGALAAF